MVATTTNIYTKLKGVFLSRDSKDPFQYSELTKLQDFYWISYEDLFDEAKLKDLWCKKDEIKFIVENRETMYAIKSTEATEMREWLDQDKEWIRIRDFYWIGIKDIQSIEKMMEIWLKKDEIQFIKWDWVDLSPYYKTWTKKTTKSKTKRK